jgi:hypothetical protein
VASSCDKSAKKGVMDGVEISCDDGKDNDEDGAKDCADLDCAEEPECLVEAMGGAGGEGAGGGGGTEAGAAGTPPDEQGGAPSSSAGAGGEAVMAMGGSETDQGGAGPVVTGEGTCASPIEGVIGEDYQELPPYAGASDFTSGSCQAVSTGVDVAYVVTGNANGILQAKAYSTDSDVDISVRSNCASAVSELDCQSYNTSGMADTVSTPILVGQKVIVIVSRATPAAQSVAYLQLLINN